MFDVFCLSVFLILGIVFVVYSPMLIRFDKSNDSCTREHKFIWEKEYHVKKLCSISDIHSVSKDFPNIQFRSHDGITLHLKTKTQMSIFPTIMGQPMAPRPRDYDKDIDEINQYILSGIKESHNPLILKFSTHIFIGIGFIAISLFGLYNIFIK